MDHFGRLHPRQTTTCQSRWLIAACASLALPPTSLPASEPRPAWTLPPGLGIACVAIEPTVIHPISVDWSDHGQLWVAEFAGTDTQGRPSSRVVLLEDHNLDQVYENRHVFLQGLPWISDILAWENGVLIAAPPNLIFADDEDDDGVADQARRLFVGFGAESIAQRLNSLQPGLDGWIYAANGRADGSIQALEDFHGNPPAQTRPFVDLIGADLRLNPLAGIIEPAAGHSWLGRMRDDFNNWFGVDADLGLVQFPFPHHYAARNPYVTSPDPVVPVPGNPGPRSVLKKINTASGSVLPPGGATLYRGLPLGQFIRPGDVVTSNPQLGLGVTSLQSSGLLFRQTDSSPSPPPTFTPKNDPAFSPVQTRTGPDDALWIVDFRSTPSLASQPQGRIYRLFDTSRTSPHPGQRLQSTLANPLIGLAQPNGLIRDRAQRALRTQPSPADTVELRHLASRGTLSNSQSIPANPAPIQVQALWTLSQLGQLQWTDIEYALLSAHPEVRRHALQLSEPFLISSFPESLQTLAADPDPRVRFQLALTAGSSPTHQATACLASLAQTDADVPWMRTAILSSAVGRELPLLSHLLREPSTHPAGTGLLVEQLVQTALANGQTDGWASRAQAVANIISHHPVNLGLRATARLLDLQPPASQPGKTSSADRWLDPLHAIFQKARSDSHPDSPPNQRITALPLLGRQPQFHSDDLRLLIQAATSPSSRHVRETAIRTLLRIAHPSIGPTLLDNWTRLLPSLRTTLLGTLLQREEWLPFLLTAIREGHIATMELTPVTRERLLRTNHPQTRHLAEQAFAATLPPRRTALIESFLPALNLTGTPDRGEVLFTQYCALCHALTPSGLRLGPDLASVGRRTRFELLESIVDPNATIDPAFRGYLVDTRDDESLSGILRRETDTTLELIMAGGIPRTVALTSVLEIKVSSLSMMPEGLEAALSTQAMADLLAYLESHRPPQNPEPHP